MKNGLITDEDGTKIWYENYEIHRLGAPAMELLYGSKVFYYHGERHRVDGPAEEWADGSKFWYLYGTKLIRPKEFKTMEEWFEKLNTDEEYSLPWIHNIKGAIELINDPTPKQKRLNALKWKL